MKEGEHLLGLPECRRSQRSSDKRSRGERLAPCQAPLYWGTPAWLSATLSVSLILFMRSLALWTLLPFVLGFSGALIQLVSG